MKKLTKKFERIVGKKWYIQGFNGCANFTFAAPQSGLVGCWRELGYGYTEKVFIFQNDYLEYLYLEDDFKNIGNKFLSLYFKNHRYLDWVIGLDSQLLAKAKVTMAKIDKTELDKLSKPKLVDLFQEMQTRYHGSMDVAHIIEGITFVVEPLLKEKLEKFLGWERHEKRFRDAFNVLMQPAQPSFASDEYLGLLEIALHIDDDKSTKKIFDNYFTDADIWQHLPVSYKKMISHHQRAFIYNQANYYHGDPLSELYYVGEIKKLLSSSANLSELISEEKKRYQINRVSREQLIKKYNFPEDIRSLVALSSKVLPWHDNRKRNLLTGVYYMNLLLRALGRAYNIPLELLKRYLPEEITAVRLAKFDFADASERMKQYMVYSKRVRGRMVFEIYKKTDFTQFMEIYLRAVNAKKEIHGNCASPGKAVGLARVCHTKEDLAQFKDKEILVAAMTRPEFVPAMKKAAAIVTDEGGITCHAAIVSRELGIPCIIGTRVGTKVLKTGDRVLVNADHGVVQKQEE